MLFLCKRAGERLELQNLLGRSRGNEVGVYICDVWYKEEAADAVKGKDFLMRVSTESSDAGPNSSELGH